MEEGRTFYKSLTGDKSSNIFINKMLFKYAKRSQTIIKQLKIKTYSELSRISPMVLWSLFLI